MEWHVYRRAAVLFVVCASIVCSFVQFCGDHVFIHYSGLCVLCVFFISSIIYRVGISSLPGSPVPGDHLYEYVNECSNADQHQQEKGHKLELFFLLPCFASTGVLSLVLRFYVDRHDTRTE